MNDGINSSENFRGDLPHIVQELAVEETLWRGQRDREAICKKAGIQPAQPRLGKLDPQVADHHRADVTEVSGDQYFHLW